MTDPEHREEITRDREAATTPPLPAESADSPQPPGQDLRRTLYKILISAVIAGTIIFFALMYLKSVASTYDTPRSIPASGNSSEKEPERHR
ncbi:MAG: hypothetical protein SFH39_08900 [Candidatus Magnetobacterium sp. LHC-1]|uniref:Uncharacterized protein n=1 Tax=Candidatus Magnetobacterium casense TaxID=1455061 RepID=A0ABS6S3N7_9BACT|nr:hypothetical protein [Candidatus Magnetobacterium casensis]MBF0609446.1 hypothetical protein [Nitrospirota bacterium]MBV6342983.1 hypothetical protein [Candidatus Magnetobacterium casensis]